MKTIRYILLATIAIAFFSCSDNYMDLYPKDQISSKTFYKTEEDFIQAIHAAYNPLRVVGADYFMAETRTDNTHYEFFSNNRGTAYIERENIADFMDTPDNSYTKQIFTNAYVSISRANAILDYLEQNQSISDDARKYITGQACFLRAFNYFKLVRYYGRIPLHLHLVTNVEGAFLPQSSVEEVYNQIIEDAKVAMNNLEGPKSFPQDGLATKGAAIMLLADVYMTLKNYKEAETLLLLLEPMGYDLLINYEDVFSTANKNSKESIFEIQFLQGLQGGMQSNFIYQFLPRSYDTSIITFGIATNNTGTGGWNTPTKNLINDYETNDKRLDISIGVAEGTYDASSYFKITAYKSIVNYQAPAGSVGVPFVKKYLNPHVDKNNTNDNWPVYRFADALLLLAEAQNELGHPEKALVHLKRIRNRAGLTTPATSPGKDALRDMIIHERRIELAFENHRWFDLLRTGKAIDVLTKYGNELKKEYSYLSPDSYKIEEYRLIYPLPRSEVEMNDLLEQNPKY